MKPASVEFKAQLAQETTTLCRIMRFTPTGRDTLYYTDHDVDLVVDGQTYLASNSFTISAIDNQLGVGKSNFDVSAILGGIVDRDDVERGIYSGAAIEVDAVFYDHVDYGVMPLATGEVRRISLPTRYEAVFSCEGFASTGLHPVSEQFSATCRAQFCDARCGLNIADFTEEIEVTGVTGTLTFSAGGMVGTAGLYDLGTVRWLTGDNAGRSSEVRHSESGVVTLLIRPPKGIQVGDTAQIERGCDKNLTTCQAYNNEVNYRGEPYMPGSDYVKAPKAAKPPTQARTEPNPLPPGVYYSS